MLAQEQNRLAERTHDLVKRAADRAKALGGSGGASADMQRSADELERDLRALQDSRPNSPESPWLERARDRMRDAADAMRTGDMAEARRMSAAADSSLEQAASSLDQDARMFPGHNHETSQRAQAANNAESKLRQLQKQIDQSTPQLGQFVGDGDRKQMRGDVDPQRGARQKAEELQGEMNHGPDGTPLSPEGERSLQGAADAMRRAERALEHGDPQSASLAQQDASEQLRQLDERLAKKGQGQKDGSGARHAQDRSGDGGGPRVGRPGAHPRRGRVQRSGADAAAPARRDARASADRVQVRGGALLRGAAAMTRVDRPARRGDARARPVLAAALLAPRAPTAPAAPARRRPKTSAAQAADLLGRASDAISELHLDDAQNAARRRSRPRTRTCRCCSSNKRGCVSIRATTREAVTLADRAIANTRGHDKKPWQQMRDLMAATEHVTHDFSRVASSDGRYVVLYPPGKDELLSSYALEVLAKADHALQAAFGIALPGPIRIEIYPSPDTLAQVSALTVEQIQTTGTVALSKWNRLMVTSPKALVRGYPWADTITHELVHMVVSRITGDRAPVWLQEGTAKLFERSWREHGAELVLDPAARGLLQNANAKNKLITFEQMYPSIAMLPSEDDAALAFAQVSTFMQLYVARHGQDALRNAFGQIEGGTDAREALAKAAEQPFAKIEGEWKASLPTKAEVIHRHAACARASSVGDGPNDESTEVVEDDARRFMRIGDLLWDRGRAGAAAREYEKAHRADKERSDRRLALGARRARVRQRARRDRSARAAGLALPRPRADARVARRGAAAARRAQRRARCVARGDLDRPVQSRSALQPGARRRRQRRNRSRTERPATRSVQRTAPALSDSCCTASGEHRSETSRCRGRAATARIPARCAARAAARLADRAWRAAARGRARQHRAPARGVEHRVHVARPEQLVRRLDLVNAPRRGRVRCAR